MYLLSIEIVQQEFWVYIFVLSLHVKKIAFLADADAKGGMGLGSPPAAKKSKVFFSQNKKFLESYETNEYAKILFETFTKVSVKKLDIFQNIFLKF